MNRALCCCVLIILIVTDIVLYIRNQSFSDEIVIKDQVIADQARLLQIDKPIYQK